MAAKTVLNYLPRKSVVHELTGTTKLVFFLLFTFASMMTYEIESEYGKGTTITLKLPLVRDEALFKNGEA